jgi:hypothetical protein
MMPPPLAYFLTWTCYGQRLHGDAKGSVDSMHNVVGTPYLPPDAAKSAKARSLMSGPPFLLTGMMRPIVHQAIRGLCDERHWRIAACDARSTHVHVVVDCKSEMSPERALAFFKARATRSLRDARLVGSDARLWTYHGSTRWINTLRGLYGAVVYVNEWQSGTKRRALEVHRAKIRAIFASFGRARARDA